MNQRKEKRKYVAGPVSNPGPLALESDVLPTALGGPAPLGINISFYNVQARRMTCGFILMLPTPGVHLSVRNTENTWKEYRFA